MTGTMVKTLSCWMWTCATTLFSVEPYVSLFLESISYSKLSTIRPGSSSPASSSTSNTHSNISWTLQQTIQIHHVKTSKDKNSLLNMYDHRRKLGRKNYSLLSTRALVDRVFWTFYKLQRFDDNGLGNVIIFTRFRFHFDVSNLVYNLRFCQQPFYTGSNFQIPRDETGTYNFPPFSPNKEEWLKFSLVLFYPHSAH